MMPSRTNAIAIGSIFTLLCCGCSTRSLSPLNYTVRAIPQMKRDSVLLQSQVVLSKLGYIVQRDHAGAVIATQFIEKNGSLRTNQGEVTSIPGKYRRVVQIQAEEVDNTLKIFCKVINEQRTTETHRLLAYDQSTSDAPSNTPIQRDAATTPEQNTVWQRIKRDKSAERQILAQIFE